LQCTFYLPRTSFPEKSLDDLSTFFLENTLSNVERII
jgi:hypothetical protein